MRQLTAYASYLDNLGAPLVGRARFYNLDGSPAVVYGLDNAHQNYVQLGHIVYTNSSGQLVPQVFLADHDYIIVFDKYIGGGTMSEDDDPESWQELGSAVDRYNTIGIVIDGDSVMSIGTIAELRGTAMTSANDGEIVMLMGYNEPGDKPVVFYKWNALSIDTDNGGSVIKATGVTTGRWKMVECPRYLDVRHFGAFPSDTTSENVTQRYAIQLAGSYAHSNGCGIYLWGDNVHTHYDITGLELYDVWADENASVFALKADGDASDAVKATVRGVKNILCENAGTSTSDQGIIQLFDDTLRTSYGPAYSVKLTPSRKLIVDSPFVSSMKTFEGITVECTVDTENAVWNFDDCMMLSAGHITRGIFSGNMTITESMFTDTCDFTQVLVDDDVVVPIDEFTSVSDWCKVVRRQNVTRFDLHGRTLDSTCALIVTDSTTITYENAVFDGFVVYSKNSKFINCSGSFVCGTQYSGMTYELVDSDLTQSNDLNFLTLNCTRSKFHNAYTRTASLLNSVDNSTIDIPAFICSVVNVKDSTISGSLANPSDGGTYLMWLECSTISGNITSRKPYIVGCTLSGNIIQESISTSITFTIIGNKFTNNAQHQLSATVSGSKLSNARWIDNVNMTSRHFIAIDRTNLDPDERQHLYEYEGNTGRYTLQRLSASWHELVRIDSTIAPKTLGFLDGTGYYFRGKMYEVDGGLTDSSYYLTSFEMFSVGTEGIEIMFKGSGPSTWNNNARSTCYSCEIPMDQSERAWNSGDINYWPRNIVFVSGWSWKVCRALYFFVNVTNQLGYLPGNTDIPFVFSVRPMSVSIA